MDETTNEQNNMMPVIAEQKSSVEITKNNENTSFIINETSKPNSFETGKAGNRLKLYFDTVENLKTQLKDLLNAGIYIKE